MSKKINESGPDLDIETAVCESMCEKKPDSAVLAEPTDGPADIVEPIASVDACTSCGTTDPADENGLCPTASCRCFRKSNKAAMTAGGYRARPTLEDQQRRDQILLDVQRDPNATTLREFQRDYAAKCVVRDIIGRYLVTMGPMTEAGRRRAALDAFLAVSDSTQRTGLAIRNAQADAPLPFSAIEMNRTIVDAVPTSALDLGLAFLRRQAAGEALTDRELGALDLLRAAMRGEVVLPPDPPRDDVNVNVQEVELASTEAQSAKPSTPSTDAPVVEATCRYCYRTLTACDEFKAAKLDRWEISHAGSPEMQRKKDIEATKIMRHQVGKFRY